MAAPTKLTPERRGKVLRALESGMTRTAAAAEAEINRDTLAGWIQRYPAFSGEVTRAEGKAEARFTEIMEKAAHPHQVQEVTEIITPEGRTLKTVTRTEFDWRAAESWLKRRRREEWADNFKQEVSGQMVVKAEDAIPSDEELRTMGAAELLRIQQTALKLLETAGDASGPEEG